jgi:3'(2'), 5'-bisphosphate nucleotidase
VIVKNLLQFMGETARQAGARIRDIHRSGFHVERKEDDSPLTEADTASNEVISRRFAETYPDIPLLSEEGASIPYEERSRWSRFLLVDPLDGTKEFVKENGEFCVCIAYVEGRYPVLGAIYAPVQDLLFYGGPDVGAFEDNGRETRRLQTAPPAPGEGQVVVASRSHPDPRLEEHLASFEIAERITRGSALKFALVAEGKATYYPRLNPTMEWDTAAGQALVEGAGGSVTTLDGERFFYNKESLKNPGFVVRA